MDLAARILADREFEVASDGITLKLREASIFDVRSTGATDPDGSQLPLLQRCVVGWSGVQAAALMAGEAGELPFARTLTEVVLDRYPHAADAAFVALMQRFVARRAAAKN